MAITKLGDYSARATDWDMQETSNRNLDITIEFKLWDDGAVEPTDEAGDRMYKHLVVTDETLARCVRSLRAMGWKGTDIMEIEKRGGGLDRLVCSVQVVEGEYNGKKRLEISWINEARGPRGVRVNEPLTDEQKKAMARRFSPSVVAGADAKNAQEREERIAKWKAENQGGGASKASRPNAAARVERASVDDSDIPF